MSTSTNKSILVTNDYSIFKKLEGNRSTSAEYVQKLVESIQSKNLLHCHPIIVNSKMEIIDGQNRLKAAEKLGLPIYYVIEDSAGGMDVILLNTNRKNWKLENYCDFYISQGNENYKKIKEYSQLYQVQLTILLNSARGTRVGSSYLNLFKNGFYTFPAEKKLERMINVLEHKVKIIEELVSLALPSEVKKLIRSDSFVRGILNFSLNEDVMLTTLQHKLKVRAESIKMCANQAAYASMIKEIYNWKNPNPVD